MHGQRDVEYFLYGAAVVGVVLVLVGALFVSKLATLAVWARRRGWTYAARDGSLATRFDGVPFGTGFRRSARHVVRGRHRGRDVLAFEYIYKEKVRRGERERTITHQHLVVAVATQQLRPDVGLADLADERARHWPLRLARDEVVTWVRGEMNARTAARMVDYLVDVADHVPRSG